MRHPIQTASGAACETERKRGHRPANGARSPAPAQRRVVCHQLVFLLSAFLVAAAVFAPRLTSARAAQREPSAAHAEEAHGPEGGRGAIDLIARLVNFGILAGTLVYLLRPLIGKYLRDRHSQIRRDLVNAAELKRSAATEMEEIDRKMKALPGELEALRAQGAQEIAAEEERIRTAAAVERDRLLEQARREIELQVKVAERELVSHAADLAVGVATERIKKTITDDDRKRLVDRYVDQLLRD